MVGIRTWVASGVAVVGVSALLLTPVVPQRAPMITEQPAVAPAAHVQSLPSPKLLVSPPQPGQLLAEQVNFHVGLAVDFIVTGAQLISRQLPVPGTLLQDIQNGTPLPVAVSRAVQTLVNVEVDAGRELVGFAAEFVNFQIGFLTSVLRGVMTTVGNTTMACAAFAGGVVGQPMTSVAAGPTPASSAPAQALSTSVA